MSILVKNYKLNKFQKPAIIQIYMESYLCNHVVLPTKWWDCMLCYVISYVIFNKKYVWRIDKYYLIYLHEPPKNDFSPFHPAFVPYLFIQLSSF